MNRIQLLFLPVLAMALLTLIAGISPTLAAPQKQQTPIPVTVIFGATSTPALPALKVTNVEPRLINNDAPAIITVFGEGFTPDTFVRLKNYGILATTYVSQNALTASVPAGAPAGNYGVEAIRGDDSDSWDNNHITIVDALSTPVPTPLGALSVHNVEPASLPAVNGGVITVMGNGFNANSVVRLVGYGALATTFVSEQMLTGQIPPGLNPGGYDVEVARGNDRAQWWQKKFYLVGATPTPGLGNLAIRSIEPASIVEGSGGSITILGDGFTADTVVRLIGYGVIPTTFVGEHTLTAEMPASLPGGNYEVEVARGDKSVRWWNRTLAVIGATPTKPFVFAQPQLLIQNVQVGDGEIRPGNQFDLRFEIANLGNATAIDVSAVLNASQVAIPAEGSNVRIFDRIGTPIQHGNVVSVTMPLVALKDVTEGQYNLTLDLTFFNIRGNQYQSQQVVGVTIGKPVKQVDGRPRLILSGYETDNALEPGGQFGLMMTLTNVGDADAENVTLTMGGQNGEALSPFALVNSGNVHFVPALAQGETIQIDKQLIILGSAEAKPYSLPIALAYEDAEATAFSDPSVLSLVVNRPPQFQISFYRPVEFAQVGVPLNLPVEVVNIGKTSVNVSNVNLTTEPELAVQDGIIFVGPLDGGTTTTIDGQVVPKSGGVLTVNVDVHYLDNFNRQQIYQGQLEVEVQDMEDAGIFPNNGVNPSPNESDNAEPEQSQSLFIRILKGLFGLGA